MDLSTYIIEYVLVSIGIICLLIALLMALKRRNPEKRNLKEPEPQ